MKAVLIVLIVFGALILIKVITGDRDLDVEDFLPVLGGYPMSIYDLTALAMILIAIIAIAKVLRRREGDD